jgi:hypothetical protein
MLSAYAYLDELLAKGIEPFSTIRFVHMLALNERVHYGTDTALMAEFASAIEANLEKFNAQIDPIAAWYWRHAGQRNHPLKLPAETYVSIVGEPAVH